MTDSTCSDTVASMKTALTFLEARPAGHWLLRRTGDVLQQVNSLWAVFVDDVKQFYGYDLLITSFFAKNSTQPKILKSRIEKYKSRHILKH